MSASTMHALAESTVATTVAILLVALVRKPLRRTAGAQVAYWVWLLVPASNFVALLPAPSKPVFSESLIATLPLTASAAHVYGAGSPYVTVGLLVWMLGALLMFVFMLHRQSAFISSLGEVTVARDGTHRSSAVRGPALVGLWQLRVVLPADFETTYDPVERELVMAHERAHRRRFDIPLSAIATLWLCLSWFNPLVYWAIGRFRSDQELACDAVVLAESGTTRRRYSDTLLKAQLASDSMFPLPAGCRWQSRHPLKERIVMIGSPLPSGIRRRFGAVATFAVIISGSFVVWTTQPTTAYAQTAWAQALARFDEGIAMRYGFNSWSLIANQAPTSCNDNDDLDFSGRLVVKPAGLPSAKPEFAALSVTHRKDGSMLLQGVVRISFKDGGILATNRATVEQDGTITMDSAHLSPGPGYPPPRPLWRLFCHPRVIGLTK